MASKSIVLKGTTYNGVESIELPQSGGGNALFTEVSDTTATAGDVASGKYFYTADGTKTAGTASGGGANIQALSVTQNGTYTASGGVDGYSPVTVNVAGSSIPWLGQGAEKVDTFAMTINLKDDTSYESWVASTTAGTIRAASATPDRTYVGNRYLYEYCVIVRCFIEPVYLPGTPTTNRTHRVAEYCVYTYYAYPNATNISEFVNGTPSNVGVLQSTTNLFAQTYYGTTGALGTRLAYNAGPCYMPNTTNLLTYSTSGSEITIQFQLRELQAKCNSTYFATDRKEQVDTANTNFQVALDIYRIPRAYGTFSHWAEEMRDALIEE